MAVVSRTLLTSLDRRSDQGRPATAGETTAPDNVGLMEASLRIMTSNLWAHNVDPAGLAGVLEIVDPDVLAVQELQEPAAAVIAGHFAHHFLHPRDDTNGGGIALRRPGVFAEVALPHRAGWSARLDPADWSLPAPLEVVSVHFSNPVSRHLRRTLAARRGQLHMLLDHVGAGEGPLVVVGDFNSSPAWPAYRRIADHLVDGPAAAGTGARTWRWADRGPYALRIDHAFVRGVTVASSRTVRVPGADHRALVADVRFPSHR